MYQSSLSSPARMLDEVKSSKEVILKLVQEYHHVSLHLTHQFLGLAVSTNELMS